MGPKGESPEAQNPSPDSPQPVEGASAPSASACPSGPVGPPVVAEQPLAEPELGSAPSSYGPVRRKITGKDGTLALIRPPAMKQDDFVEVMKD